MDASRRSNAITPASRIWEEGTEGTRDAVYLSFDDTVPGAEHYHALTRAGDPALTLQADGTVTAITTARMKTFEAVREHAPTLHDRATATRAHTHTYTHTHALSYTCTYDLQGARLRVDLVRLRTIASSILLLCVLACVRACADMFI